jgi:hypothetical protein
VGVRASTGGRFAPGGANGGRRSSGGGGMCGRRSGQGRVFVVAEGWLGGPRVNHVTGTRGVGSKARRRAADQRPTGEERVAHRRVEFIHMAPSKRSWMSRTVASRRDAWTDGFSGTSACTPDERTAVRRRSDVARARRRVRVRSGVAG